MFKENMKFDFSESSESSSAEEAKIIFTETLNARAKSIHENALAKAKKYLVAEAELLEAIIQVDRAKIYHDLGLGHLTPYCEKYLNLSRDVAANFVRVARKSLEVPELQLAVEEGLSVTKAKTIVSVLTPQNQQSWIEKAQTFSKEKLEKEVAKENPSAKKPEKAKVTGENRTRLEFELSDAEMVKQKRAADIVSRKLGKIASLAEVQKALLENFLKHHDPVEKAERATKRKKTKPAQESKSIPAAVKHQVNLRDRGCCQANLPGGSVCSETRWVDFHHIIPKARGGADTAENLITLCSAHHRLWHARAG